MELEQNNKTKRPIRVLVVEDEILVSEWVAQELTEQGFAVQAATNADDAVGHLATQAVDVLFTDLNLPGGMNGAAPAMAQSRRGLCLGERHSARARSAVPGAFILPKPYHPALVGRLLTALSRTMAATAPA